jgi:hypothetical protein
MRRRSAPTMSFRGFIVLADIIFALAAGFMLLHPLQSAVPHVPPPPPPPIPRPDVRELEMRLERLLVRLHSNAADLEALEQRRKSGAPAQ